MKLAIFVALMTSCFAQAAQVPQYDATCSVTLNVNVGFTRETVASKDLTILSSQEAVVYSGRNLSFRISLSEGRPGTGDSRTSLLVVDEKNGLLVASTAVDSKGLPSFSGLNITSEAYRGYIFECRSK